ncbi:hypothetical protein HYPGJ_20317 [Hyphomicrobium sp. GJ21]|nr:hypothetical protein HYPGJ_20317 [Hyphomicrobium sp. GJ21]
MNFFEHRQYFYIYQVVIVSVVLRLSSLRGANLSQAIGFIEAIEKQGLSLLDCYLSLLLCEVWSTWQNTLCLTHRSGSENLYYKRSVPTELRAPGRPKQVWKSLGTPDRNKAQRAYAAKHAEIELVFKDWRATDNRPVTRERAEASCATSRTRICTRRKVYRNNVARTRMAAKDRAAQTF